jgi:hypothetical protein
MRKPSFQAVSLSLPLLLSIIFATSNLAQTGARRSRAQQSKSTVLFESYPYGDNRMIEPIVIMQGGRYVAPPSFNMKAARRQFANRYYRPGQKYRLLYDGGEVGTVTVKDQKVCDAIAANVEMQASAAVESLALATDSDALGKRLVKSRWLNDDEKAAIMKLVLPVFRRGKVDEPFFEGVANSVEAADLNGDGKDELIGTFASGAKSQHTLFIIAEPHGNGYRSALLFFNPARDENGDNIVRPSFLKGIDLDGDSVAEVIVSVSDYRSLDDSNFVIYKKQGGRWRSIYKGGGIRCPEERGEHR